MTRPRTYRMDCLCEEGQSLNSARYPSWPAPVSVKPSSRSIISETVPPCAQSKSARPKTSAPFLIGSCSHGPDRQGSRATTVPYGELTAPEPSDLRSSPGGTRRLSWALRRDDMSLLRWPVRCPFNGAIARRGVHVGGPSCPFSYQPLAAFNLGCLRRRRGDLNTDSGRVEGPGRACHLVLTPPLRPSRLGQSGGCGR